MKPPIAAPLSAAPRPAGACANTTASKSPPPNPPKEEPANLTRASQNPSPRLSVSTKRDFRLAPTSALDPEAAAAAEVAAQASRPASG